MSGDNTSINNGSYPFTHDTAFVTHPSHPLPPAQYPVGSVMFPATYGYTTFPSQAAMFPQVIPYPYNGSNCTPGALFSSTYIPRPQLTYSRNGPVQNLTRNIDTSASSHLAENTGFYTTPMADEPQDHNMHGKPLFDILLKLPWKSLLRFRCVSKLWREYIDDSYFVSLHDKQVMDTPIMFYSKITYKMDTLCFYTIESDTITNHVLKAKNEVPVFEFVVMKSLYYSYTDFVGSCNGLVLIESLGTDNLVLIYIVIHPIIKQCYVLPKLPYVNDSESRVACGLGFDSSTNTFKMVCVCSNPNYPYVQWTMVHVLGTKYSWHRIPQVPSYPISGNAIFAHGCLHWLVDYDSGEDGTQHVIWFDVKNEEFGLIKPLKTKSKPSKRKYNHPAIDYLVNLDGQVGYFGNNTTEVWVLNDKKEWVLHCDFEDREFPHDGVIEVLACLNKDGDILIKVTTGRGKESFYIYNLKNRVIHKARIDGLDLEDGCKRQIVMFPNSLCDIITNSNLFKKRA